MTSPVNRQTAVFIVRVWAEYLNNQPPSWRGVVEGREPGEITPFTSVEQMTQIIQKKSKPISQTPDAEENQDQILLD